MKKFFAALILAAFALGAAEESFAQNLSQSVTIKRLRDAGDVTSDSLQLFIPTTSADTTQFENPWSYTGIVFEAVALNITETATFYVVAQVGNDTVYVRTDSLLVSSAGKYAWMPDIPIAQKLRFIFRGTGSNSAWTYVKNIYLNRQW